jgi:hypothetical protein
VAQAKEKEQPKEQPKEQNQRNKTKGTKPKEQTLFCVFS